MGLLAHELWAQEIMVVKFSMRTSDFRFETQDGYDVIISLHDKMARMAIPGHPQLPTWDNYPVQEEIPHEEDEGLVSLKLYDVSGRCVQTVFSENKTTGYYDLSIPIKSPGHNSLVPPHQRVSVPHVGEHHSKGRGHGIA